MITLSYGVKKPQAPDKGGVFFPALESNAQQQNDHTHNGVDSAPIPSQNISRSTQAIAAGSWAAAGNRFNQTITLPAGFTHLGTLKRFFINGGSSDGEEVFPSIEKGASANQYVIYTNDNTLSYTALYV